MTANSDRSGNGMQSADIIPAGFIYTSPLVHFLCALLSRFFHVSFDFCVVFKPLIRA